METVTGILLIMLFICILGGVLLFATTPAFLHKILVIIEGDDFSNIQNETHWTHMPLTYRISPNISNIEISNIEIALNRIHQLVPNITFVRTNELDEDILFLSKEIEISSTEIASAQMNYSIDEKYIKHALIYIPRYQTDKILVNTDIEVHEILHSFGFNHVDKIGNIMYPYVLQDVFVSDSLGIDKEYSDCLNYIYSNGYILGFCKNIEINITQW